jgi:hypothetical protein
MAISPHGDVIVALAGDHRWPLQDRSLVEQTVVPVAPPLVAGLVAVVAGRGQVSMDVGLVNDAVVVPWF